MRPCGEAIRPLVSFFLALAICLVWVVCSKNDILEKDVRCFFFMSGTLYANMSCRLIVAQVSISPIFYEQLFCTEVFCTAFLLIQFGFVIFWQKNVGAKAVCKMLVKLTTGVNFINILRAAFAPVYPKSVKRYCHILTSYAFRT